MQARITRAKKTLAAAQGAVRGAAAGRAAARLGSVLSVVYVIFTEGSTATSGDDLIRSDLAGEALRLARVLARLVPDEAEVHGLLALLELTAARFPARTGPDGEPVLLERPGPRPVGSRGDPPRAGRAGPRAAAGRGLGAYGLQAAIAECHAVAPSVGETDWERVVVLYEALGRLAPSPVVELNRAVAVAMAHGPAEALLIVDELVAAARSPARTCCRACAANCSPGSAGATRRRPNWNAPPLSAATNGSAQSCDGSGRDREKTA